MQLSCCSGTSNACRPDKLFGLNNENCCDQWLEGAQNDMRDQLAENGGRIRQISDAVSDQEKGEP